MTQFAEEVRRRIRAAIDSELRRQAALQADLQAEEQRRKALAERSAQAGLLIEQRFGEAVNASEGLLTYTAPEGWKNTNEREEASKTYELVWKGPDPRRTLEVTLYANGTVSIRVLGMGRPVSESSTVLGAAFEGQLEHAVFDLIAQEAWRSRARSALGDTKAASEPQLLRWMRPQKDQGGIEQDQGEWNGM
jgi:hypothetical protein